MCTCWIDTRHTLITPDAYHPHKSTTTHRAHDRHLSICRARRVCAVWSSLLRQTEQTDTIVQTFNDKKKPSECHFIALFSTRKTQCDVVVYRITTTWPLPNDDESSSGATHVVRKKNAGLFRVDPSRSGPTTKKAHSQPAQTKMCIVLYTYIFTVHGVW